jgi:hypothetical protein
MSPQKELLELMNRFLVQNGKCPIVLRSSDTTKKDAKILCNAPR